MTFKLGQHFHNRNNMLSTTGHNKFWQQARQHQDQAHLRITTHSPLQRRLPCRRSYWRQSYRRAASGRKWWCGWRAGCRNGRQCIWIAFPRLRGSILYISLILQAQDYDVTSILKPMVILKSLQILGAQIKSSHYAPTCQTESIGVHICCWLACFTNLCSTLQSLSVCFQEFRIAHTVEQHPRVMAMIKTMTQSQIKQIGNFVNLHGRRQAGTLEERPDYNTFFQDVAVRGRLNISQKLA